MFRSVSLAEDAPRLLFATFEEDSLCIDRTSCDSIVFTISQRARIMQGCLFYFHIESNLHILKRLLTVDFSFSRHMQNQSQAFIIKWTNIKAIRRKNLSHMQTAEGL